MFHVFLDCWRGRCDFTGLLHPGLADVTSRDQLPSGAVYFAMAVSVKLVLSVSRFLSLNLVGVPWAFRGREDCGHIYLPFTTYSFISLALFSDNGGQDRRKKHKKTDPE